MRGRWFSLQICTFQAIFLQKILTPVPDLGPGRYGERWLEGIFGRLATSRLSSYAGTSLICAGIRQWKSVSFHCWAVINLVCEMSNEEEPPYTLNPPPVTSSWELKWHEQWGGGGGPAYPHPSSVISIWEWNDMSSEEEEDPPYPPSVFSSWELKWHEHWGGGGPTPTPHQSSAACPHRE